MTQAEKIFDESITRYISPSRYESMVNSGWFFESVRWQKSREVVLRMIQEYIDRGVTVRGGYMATDIKEYHDYYIISKE
jgi:hypothetical protein